MLQSIRRWFLPYNVCSCRSIFYLTMCAHADQYLPYNVCSCRSIFYLTIMCAHADQYFICVRDENCSIYLNEKS